MVDATELFEERRMLAKRLFEAAPVDVVEAREARLREIDRALARCETTAQLRMF